MHEQTVRKERLVWFVSLTSWKLIFACWYNQMQTKTQNQARLDQLSNFFGSRRCTTGPVTWRQTQVFPAATSGYTMFVFISQTSWGCPISPRTDFILAPINTNHRSASGFSSSKQSTFVFLSSHYFSKESPSAPSRYINKDLPLIRLPVSVFSVITIRKGRRPNIYNRFECSRSHDPNDTWSGTVLWTVRWARNSLKRWFFEIDSYRVVRS